MGLAMPGGGRYSRRSPISRETTTFRESHVGRARALLGICVTNLVWGSVIVEILIVIA